MAEPCFAVVGAGPVGTLLVETLQAGGAATQWVVRNPARRAQLAALANAADGVDGTAGARTVEEATALCCAELDWLILAVKAQQVEPLLASLTTARRERTLVVANGLHQGPFVLGALYGGGKLDGQGRLVCGTESKLVLGALGYMPDEPAALKALAHTLDAGRLETRLVSDIRAEMWHKLVMNCAVNALTALLDCINGGLLPLLDSPLIIGVVAEVAQVMTAEGVALPEGGVEALRADLRALMQVTAGNSSSMREDLRAGRETEMALLNLAVAAVGVKHGLECPLNAALGRMVSSLTNRGAP